MYSISMSKHLDRLKWLLQQKSLYIAILLWLLLCGAGLLISKQIPSYEGLVKESSRYLVLVLLAFGVVMLLTRKRPIPDLAQRSPERVTALRETLALWAYIAAVMVAGRLIGQHIFGEGIALHLNGSLVGATRVQSPTEVYTWAAYNGLFFALIPYLAFRMRGYSNQQLNLKSSDWKNDLLVILVVLAFSTGMDLMGPNIFQLTPHQQLAGGLMSFWLHLFGTDLPIMIAIYSILLPRYFRLFSPMTAYLLGAISYPTMHIFESGTRYNSLPAATASLAFVYLLFIPAGLMKSFLPGAPATPGSISGPTTPSPRTSQSIRV
jgi:hypothetical protein